MHYREACVSIHQNHSSPRIRQLAECASHLINLAHRREAVRTLLPHLEDLPDERLALSRELPGIKNLRQASGKDTAA